MKGLPFKTKGMYYRIDDYKPKQTKLNRMWNVLSDQEVLNGDVYNAIYFGKYFNTQTRVESYYAGIDLSMMSANFKQFSLGYRNNDNKYSGWENDRVCYDFTYNGNSLFFQNELWKCTGVINDDILDVSFKNKNTGHSFSMRLNHLLQPY
jgi:hypothetical protein